MTQGALTAKEIYQELLDDIGDAHRQRNFDTFRRFFILPHWFVTFETERNIEDEDQLRLAFDAMCKHMDRVGISQPTRVCLLADFEGADKIKGCHESRLINGLNHVESAFVVFSTLVRGSDTWMVAESQYAESAPSLPSIAMSRLECD